MKPTVSFNQMNPPLVSWSLCQSSLWWYYLGHWQKCCFVYPDSLIQTTTTQVLCLYFFFLHPFISLCTVLLSRALFFCWRQLQCLNHFYSGNICRSKLTVWDKTNRRKNTRLLAQWFSDFSLFKNWYLSLLCGFRPPVEALSSLVFPKPSEGGLLSDSSEGLLRR